MTITQAAPLGVCDRQRQVVGIGPHPAHIYENAATLAGTVAQASGIAGTDTRGWRHQHDLEGVEQGTHDCAPLGSIGSGDRDQAMKRDTHILGGSETQIFAPDHGCPGITRSGAGNQGQGKRQRPGSRHPHDRSSLQAVGKYRLERRQDIETTIDSQRQRCPYSHHASIEHAFDTGKCM